MGSVSYLPCQGCGQEEWDGITAGASAATLHPFVTGAIEPGSTVIADAWQGYSGLEGLGCTREPRSQSAARARGPARWAAGFSAWI